MTIAVQVKTQERDRVLTTAVLRAADKLHVNGKELSDILGVSAPTISRMKKADHFLEEGSKTFELGVLFVRFFRSLDAITGGDTKVSNQWLRNDNSALGGIPLDIIKSITGLTNGLAYLDSRRAPL